MILYNFVKHVLITRENTTNRLASDVAMTLVTFCQEDTNALEAACAVKQCVSKYSGRLVEENTIELMYERARVCVHNYYMRYSIKLIERMDETSADVKACRLAHTLVHGYVRREYWPASGCARGPKREVAKMAGLTPSRKSNNLSFNTLRDTNSALHFHADRGTLGFEPSLRADLMNACVTVSDFLLWPPSATWAIMQICDRLLHRTASVNIYFQFCGNHMRSDELEVAHQAYELFMNALICVPPREDDTKESSHVKTQTRRFARCLLAFLLARIVNGVVSPIGREEIYSTVLTFKNIMDAVYRVIELASDERVSISVVTYLWNTLTLQLLDGHLWTFDPLMYLQVPMYDTGHAKSAIVLSGRCSGILKRSFDPSIGPSVAFPGQNCVPCEKCCLCTFPPLVMSSTELTYADRTFGTHALYTSILRPRLKSLFPYTVANTQDDLTVTSRMSTLCLLAAYVGFDGDAPVCDVAIVALLVEFRLWRRAAHLSGVTQYFDVFSIANEIALQDSAFESTATDWNSWSVQRTEQSFQDLQRLQESCDSCNGENACDSQGCRDSQDSQASNPTATELPIDVTSIYDWRNEWVQNVARDVEALYLEALFPGEEVHPSYQKIASSYGTLYSGNKQCHTKVLYLLNKASIDSSPLFTLISQQELRATRTLPIFTSLGTDPQILESKKRALEADLLESKTWPTCIAAPRDHLIQNERIEEADATPPSSDKVPRHTIVATPVLHNNPAKVATRAKLTRRLRNLTTRHHPSSC